MQNVNHPNNLRMIINRLSKGNILSGSITLIKDWVKQQIQKPKKATKVVTLLRKAILKKYCQDLECT